MELALVFFGPPLATYLILTALPFGRPALIGCFVAIAIAAVLGVSQMNGEDFFLLAQIILVISAIALAGLVQLLRVMIGVKRPRWAYPLIVALALTCAGIPTIRFFGV